MEGRWDLNALYKGFDDPAYHGDMEKLAQILDAYRLRVQELEAAGGKLTAADLAGLLELEEQIWVVETDLELYCSMCKEADASQTEAANGMATVKKLKGSVGRETAQVRRWIGAMELTEADFAAWPILDAYRFHLKEAGEQGRHQMDLAAEDLLAKMEGCSGSVWTDQRGYLTSFAHATFEGKELTLTQLRSLAHSKDPAVRKAAFEAELECSRSIEGGMCFALNGIKEYMNLMADLRGYDGIIDMTMAQSRMERKTLDALWDAVRDALPKFHSYLRRKAELMGYENGLPWYEMLAEFGESSRKFDVDGARTFLIEQLGVFSKDLGDLVDRAFRENWIDFYSRPGKSGGAFCRNLTNQKQSRVLTNFTGTLDGVVTIAHELGHAYHGQQIENHRPLNRTYTMPVAETASNFNETLVMNTALSQADEEERVVLLEQRIQDFTQTICDIYSRFLFEEAVFTERRKGFLFPQHLCQLMEEAQKAAYGDGLDHNCLHPYMWINKVHYYYTHLSFYNFPYAFGTLFALGLYSRWQKEGESFVQRYKDMLRATTVTTVEEAAALAGVDVTTKDFWAESLSVATGMIDEFLRLTEKN